MVYELKLADVNDYAPLVQHPDQGSIIYLTHWDGKPKIWPSPIKVQKFFDKKRKIQKERADIGWFCPGAIVLSRRAFDALHKYLEQFGELLQLDCEDGEAWLYNCTTLIECVDVERSGRFVTMVQEEVFFEDKIPTQACIFKDPATVLRTIYLNQSAKDDLEKLFAEHQLTGGRIIVAGTENL